MGQLNTSPFPTRPTLLLTRMLSSSMGFDRSDTSICRFSAYEEAALTRPSSSAPLKFFVSAAQQVRRVLQMVRDCG